MEYGVYFMSDHYALKILIELDKFIKCDDV